MSTVDPETALILMGERETGKASDRRETALPPARE